MPDLLTLSLLIFAAAVLYSSVGHAGASGYLAVMALLSVAPEAMKPTALVLNVLVATIGTVQFVRAGHFSFSFFWPFALGSIPFAFYGGYLKIEGDLYKQIVGVILILSALRMAFARKSEVDETRPVHIVVRVVGGALIGFLAGLTGTGGGIFLSPLILLCKWADVKRTAATSVVFILVNSLAGLGGNVAQFKSIPSFVPYLLVAAGVGGLVGSELGSKRLDNVVIKRVLAVVLLVAGFKLLLV
jgi:uncharacterized membrane protein YfcA